MYSGTYTLISPACQVYTFKQNRLSHTPAMLVTQCYSFKGHKITSPNNKPLCLLGILNPEAKGRIPEGHIPHFRRRSRFIFMVGKAGYVTINLNQPCPQQCLRAVYKGHTQRSCFCVALKHLLCCFIYSSL